MITLRTGSIFDSGCRILVNPVNCKGVMGAGLAKEFATCFPWIMQPYKAACAAGELRLGYIQWVEDSHYWNVIVNFTTKNHWKEKTELVWVERGLYNLAGYLTCYLKSYLDLDIAVPALGCGLGGLDWHEVRPLIETVLGGLPSCNVNLYPPQ